MIPKRILERFQTVPDELLAQCTPHRWEVLTSPPAGGLRSIRDIIVHMVDAEQLWVHYRIAGQPRQPHQPEAFGDLEAIRRVWRPQRDATVALARAMSAEEWRSQRPLPDDPEWAAAADEIFWHVVTHDQYHRGQIFTRLALLGRRDLPDLDLLRCRSEPHLRITPKPWRAAVGRSHGPES